ncbi:MAG: type II secretion system protein GspD [Candidatus Omnitrophica bacterium]|nr:type II secretion system protein GspD [Candidatus Omnitrophota bacterium]
MKPAKLISVILLGCIVFVGQLRCAEGSDNLSTLMEEAEGGGSVEQGMDQLISLDLRGLEVTDALKYLSVRGGMNIVVSKNVTGRITFMLTDVSIRDVFDIILCNSNLAYEKKGDVYTIMTDKEYQQRYGKQFSDVRQIKMFRLKYAIPENAFTLLDALKSEIGRLVIDQESGTVLVMDTPEKIKEIDHAISVLEERNAIKIFELRYAKAKDIEEQLKEKLDVKKVGTIKADERSNQVIVQALPERMKEIEQLISALDRKTREVLIDAKIIKITLSDDSVMGVEWEGLFKSFSAHAGLDFIGSHPVSALDRLGKSFVDDFATRVASAPDAIPADDWNRIFTSTSIPTAGAKMTLSEKIYFGKTNKWEAVLNFLETIGHTKILSNPKLVVVDNQEAKIHVGKREAYVTTTTTTGQTTSTVSEDVTFIDVGIQLSVTPTINADGYVRMKIRPEISSVVGTLETPTKNLIPIVDTSMAETTVMVKDGSTIVIGGLRKDEKVYQSKQVPFFSKLPLIGNLLKSETYDNEQTELLILITPHIVEGDVLVIGDLKEIGEEGIKLYRDYTSYEEAKAKSVTGDFGRVEKGNIKPYRAYSVAETENGDE